MRLIVKNTFFSATGSSKVLDEQGNVAYKVKGSYFSNNISHKHRKLIKDKNGKILYYVKDKRLHSPNKFTSYIFAPNMKLVATVSNNGIFTNGFTIEGATKPITLSGKGWNLDITLGDQIIGHVSLPQKMTVDDTYVLDINDPKDAPFLVAMMIAVDNIHDHMTRR